MQVSMNESYDFGSIDKDGAELKIMKGKGYTGLINLGNSCYMNSVLQCIGACPRFASRYSSDIAREHVLNCKQALAAQCMECQMYKLGLALLSEEHPGGVRPYMFKSLIARGHKEFCGGKQQDAGEYFLYLLEKIESFEKEKGGNTADMYVLF